MSQSTQATPKRSDRGYMHRYQNKVRGYEGKAKEYWHKHPIQVDGETWSVIRKVSANILSDLVCQKPDKPYYTDEVEDE